MDLPVKPSITDVSPMNQYPSEITAANTLQFNRNSLANSSPASKHIRIKSKGAAGTQYHSPAAYFRNQQMKRSSQKQVNRPVFFDAALSSNSNYMNVIKESHESILRRKQFEVQRRKILDMNFSTKADVMDMSNLNSFIQVKQKERQASQLDTNVMSDLEQEKRENSNTVYSVQERVDDLSTNQNNLDPTDVKHPLSL